MYSLYRKTMSFSIATFTTHIVLFNRPYFPTYERKLWCFTTGVHRPPSPPIDTEQPSRYPLHVVKVTWPNEIPTIRYPIFSSDFPHTDKALASPDVLPAVTTHAGHRNHTGPSARLTDRPLPNARVGNTLKSDFRPGPTRFRDRFTILFTNTIGAL